MQAQVGDQDSKSAILAQIRRHDDARTCRVMSSLHAARSHKDGTPHSSRRSRGVTVGAPEIHSGGGALQRSDRTSRTTMRFSAGHFVSSAAKAASEEAAPEFIRGRRA
jgi:hypothetical protein